MGLNAIALLAFLVSVIVLVNRYIFGTLLKLADTQPETDRLPSVTVVIPCYNEGEHIYRTVKSLCGSDYPRHLLSVMVMDDCSQDGSHEWACRAGREADIPVTVSRAERNMGKRMNISQAVMRATSEIIVSVDSDVIVSDTAIRQLVSKFSDDRIGAVGGQVGVSNPNETWMTKMQTVKYFFGYEYLKSLENHQKQVMCLSGCLTAYRRSVLVELDEQVRNRNLLGVPIKYGEDRYLTRQIVKRGYGTIINMKARCYTKAPPTVLGYFKQQLRWRRSNFADFLQGVTHPTRLTPIVALNYYTVFAVQLLYPVILVQLFATWHVIPSMLLHMALLSCMGLFYCLQTRDLPEEYKTNPVWFLSLALIMPITYVILSIVALCTLDSGSWETRAGKESK